eukprot:g8065.t1
MEPSNRLAQIRRHLLTQQPSQTSKLCTASEAVECVSSDSRITVAGFVGSGCPEELLNVLRKRFDQTGLPQRLKLITGVVVGDGKGRGMDVLAADGLLTEMVYAWAGTTPSLIKLIHASKIKAWNLPAGCSMTNPMNLDPLSLELVTQMIRDCGAGRIGPLTPIGLGTFVDPLEQGGKKNQMTNEDIVRSVEINGKRLLWYLAPKKIDIAILRGTTADIDGNITFEKEALLSDSLLKAIAVHNSNGKVLVQVERIVERNSIPTRNVQIPGALVDKIIVCSDPRLHLQTFKSVLYDPSLSGEKKVWLDIENMMELNERKVIAHRAFYEINKPEAIVNLGIGMPEGVAMIAAMYGDSSHSFVLTTDLGAVGGYPRGGLEFGTAQNATMHLTLDTIFDFYNGDGIDVAFLGMAEVDMEGNVNVSDFGNGRMPGCGGFIDISQSAKKVVFMGCFTSGGLKIRIAEGKLNVLEEGRETKFNKRVKEKTFAASSSKGREVLYITERAVFQLDPTYGFQLIEIAEGFKVEDIEAAMEFTPRLAKQVKRMDSRIFFL